MSLSSLRTRLLSLEQLPTLPDIVLRVLEVVDDKDSSAEDLVRILEMDHAISAGILRLANSAFYGFERRIDSVRRAVVVLGFDAVPQLALVTTTMETFGKLRQMAFDPHQFWCYSLGAARAVQLLCQAGVDVESTAACYTGALMHDIGRFCMAVALGQEYRTTVEEARSELRRLETVEQMRFGMTSREAGAWLAQRWRLPELICHIIEHIDEAPVWSGKWRMELAVVDEARHLAAAAGHGTIGSATERPLDPEIPLLLGLTPEKETALLDELTSNHAAIVEYLSSLRH